MTGLTPEEIDFVRWMDELDLEEVNLLKAKAVKPLAKYGGTQAGDGARALSGESNTHEAPQQRGSGWDENE